MITYQCLFKENPKIRLIKVQVKESANLIWNLKKNWSKKAPKLWNVKKHLVAGRVIAQLCQCKLNCHKILTPNVHQIFNGFWDLGNFDKQNSYLFGSIRSVRIKRLYGQAKANPEQLHKKHTFHDCIKISGADVRLCKQSFMAGHGLQNSRGRIFNILKIIKTSSSPKLDARGKDNTRPKKVSEHKVKGVRSHINIIPKHQSHYSRHEKPLKEKIYEDLKKFTGDFKEIKLAALAHVFGTLNPFWSFLRSYLSVGLFGISGRYFIGGNL